jgi:hypothetical protein
MRWVLRKVLMVLGSLVGGESGMVVGGCGFVRRMRCDV